MLLFILLTDNTQYYDFFLSTNQVKPRVRLSEGLNINQNVMYTSVGKVEQIKCIVDAYPPPIMSLLRNGSPLSDESYVFNKSETVRDQV